MAVKNYEAVFILNPILSDAQVKETVDKFKEVVTSHSNGDLYHEENWGLRKLAYPIQHKSTGYYILFEFKAQTTVVNVLETAFKRDERVMRFLTLALDKHALEYNEKRKKGAFKKTEKKEDKKNDTRK
ncbi:MAG: 30S ribosomal protein S6 [Bacteroidetes bacterium]|nr:MAG: 30S ribosomal protein S6 [Bacteroidota bacterium]